MKQDTWWKPVAGYEEEYEVSGWGEVRSVDRIVEYSNGNLTRHKGRTLSPDYAKDGYSYVRLSKNGDTRKCSIHALVIYAFIGPPGGTDLCVHHIDGDRRNNRADNLEWVTQRQNNQNTKKHREGKLLGTLQKPSGNWQARITIEGVRYSLGTYTTEREAHEAYIRKLELIGEYLI